MPLNTLRLNHAPSSHPNNRIVFIKPLPRPPTLQHDHETADKLLRAIAAQCLPIMKSHYLSVTTLEEHEPNPEFIGRNFNNGEIIQLVLRGKNGGWLPVNMIQMVMMHELAHNMHMNHGKQFWITRNLFAEEMRALWAKGYTGEGFWGGGRTFKEVGDAVEGNVVRSAELKDLPLCGGTFRSRRRKRKGKKDDGLTWKEKKERRIEKKFGKNGLALGEDEDKRLSLELSGKGPVGVKPRVAKSKRGRELRAAAALARFGTNKKEVEDLDTVKTEEEETGSEDDYEDADAGEEDARDTNGKRLLDSKGEGMVKVCEEEDSYDVNVKQEMEELEGLEDAFTKDYPSNETNGTAKPTGGSVSLYDIPQHQDEPADEVPTPSRSDTQPLPTKPKITIHKSQAPKRSTPVLSNGTESNQHRQTEAVLSTNAIQQTVKPSTRTCPICSLINPSTSVTCTACAHVLDRRKDPNSWQCASAACQTSDFVNSGDVGVCGICGTRRDT